MSLITAESQAHWKRKANSLFLRVDVPRRHCPFKVLDFKAAKTLKAVPDLGVPSQSSPECSLLLSEYQTTQQNGRDGNLQGKAIMSHTVKPRAPHNIVRRNFFLMHEILLVGTIIFSGCSRIKLNLEELNVTSLPPPVLLTILQGLLNIILQSSTWMTD